MSFHLQGTNVLLWSQQCCWWCSLGTLLSHSLCSSHCRRKGCTIQLKYPQILVSLSVSLCLCLSPLSSWQFRFMCLIWLSTSMSLLLHRTVWHVTTLDIIIWESNFLPWTLSKHFSRLAQRNAHLANFLPTCSTHEETLPADACGLQSDPSRAAGWRWERKCH